MKKYCLVQSGSVVEGPRILPECDANTSNLNLLDDASLKQLGWLPVEVVSDNKPVVVSSTLAVFEDKVVETVVTRDKNEQEIAADVEFQWQLVRQERNRLLFDSDKNVLADRWENYDTATRSAWSVYRQTLRDIPQSFLSPGQVVYPAKP